MNVLAIFFNIYLLHIYVFQLKKYGFSHKGVFSGTVKTCIFFIFFKNQGVWWVLYVVLCPVHHLNTDKHSLLFNWGGITLLLTTVVKYLYVDFLYFSFQNGYTSIKKGSQLCSTQEEHQSWMELILSCIFMFVMRNHSHSKYPFLLYIVNKNEHTLHFRLIQYHLKYQHI